MHRCTSPIRTAHGSALSDKKLHLDQKMANSHCFAQGRALGSISRRKRRLFTPRRTLQIAVKNLTQDSENVWALHPLLLAFFELRGLHFRVESAYSSYLQMYSNSSCVKYGDMGKLKTVNAAFSLTVIAFA